MGHRNDLYANRENIDPEKRFWWEKLPILKHLSTKRALAKMHDARLDLLLEELGYDNLLHFKPDSTFCLEKRKKKRGKSV